MKNYQFKINKLYPCDYLAKVACYTFNVRHQRHHNGR